MRISEVILVFGVACCLTSNRVVASTPAEILTRYRASLAPLDDSTVVVVLSEESTAGGKVTRGLSTSICVRKGGRAFAQHTRSYNKVQPGALHTVRDSTVTMNWLREERLFALERRAGNQQASLYVWRKPRDYQLAAWQGSILCGYFPGDSERIDRVLQNAGATVRSLLERADGIECLVLDATNEDTRYSVWFAPARDHCIVRLTRVSTGKELEDRIAKARSPPDTRSGLLPRSGIVRVTHTLDHVQLQQVDGKWLPVSGVLIEEVLYKDGPPSRVEMHVHRKHLELNPVVSDEIFTPRIPNGTRARFVGAHSGLPQEWRDGEIVPSEDKKTEDRLKSIVRGQRFVAPATYAFQVHALRAPGLFFCGILVVCVLMCLRF